MNYQGHVKDGMVVLGQPLPLPDGTPVRVEPVMSVTPAFWQTLSLDELAACQGVASPAGLEDYMGGWPSDELEDGFEDVVVRWRQQELEQQK